MMMILTWKTSETFMKKVQGFDRVREHWEESERKIGRGRKKKKEIIRWKNVVQQQRYDVNPFFHT